MSRPRRPQPAEEGRWSWQCRRGGLSSAIADGDTFAAHELTTIRGDTVRIRTDHLVHLQFRRFAGCPICRPPSSLDGHAQRRDCRRRDPGGRRLSLLRRRPPSLCDDSPSPSSAIPSGSCTGSSASRQPRAPCSTRAPGCQSSGCSARLSRESRDADSPRRLSCRRAGQIGLPADVLVAGDGRVLASKYGVHAYDQWSVDELLELARRRGGGGSRG